MKDERAAICRPLPFVGNENPQIVRGFKRGFADEQN